MMQLVMLLLVSNNQFFFSYFGQVLLVELLVCTFDNVKVIGSWFILGHRFLMRLKFKWLTTRLVLYYEHSFIHHVLQSGPLDAFQMQPHTIHTHLIKKKSCPV